MSVIEFHQRELAAAQSMFKAHPCRSTYHAVDHCQRKLNRVLSSMPGAEYRPIYPHEGISVQKEMA